MDELEKMIEQARVTREKSEAAAEKARADSIRNEKEKAEEAGIGHLRKLRLAIGEDLMKALEGRGLETSTAISPVWKSPIGAMHFRHKKSKVTIAMGIHNGQTECAMFIGSDGADAMPEIGSYTGTISAGCLSKWVPELLDSYFRMG
jgi:hypothetical protein